MDPFESLNLKFSSGNSIPVERAVITREEFQELQLVHENDQKIIQELTLTINKLLTYANRHLLDDHK